MPAGVVEQVAQHLSEPGARRRAPITGSPRPRPARSGATQPHPVGLGPGQLQQVHRLPAQLDAGVDAGQREQVVHQPAGAAGLPQQQQVQPLALLGRQLGGHRRLGHGLHAGQRGAQLVRGVGDEPPRAGLGRPRGRLGALQLVEHRVERGGGAAQLGVGARRGEPAAAVAAGDRAGQRGHRVQRGERDAGGEQHDDAGHARAPPSLEQHQRAPQPLLAPRHRPPSATRVSCEPSARVLAAAPGRRPTASGRRVAGHAAGCPSVVRPRRTRWPSGVTSSGAHPGRLDPAGHLGGRRPCATSCPARRPARRAGRAASARIWAANTTSVRTATSSSTAASTARLSAVTRRRRDTVQRRSGTTAGGAAAPGAVVRRVLPGRSAPQHVAEPAHRVHQARLAQLAAQRRDVHLHQVRIVVGVAPDPGQDLALADTPGRAGWPGSPAAAARSR